MSSIARKILSIAATAATAMAMIAVAPPDVSAASNNSVSDRISGADRYDTAALIADRFGSANAVVIANGENAKQGVDALSANYLAGQVHAPILLTAENSVSPDTLAAVTKILTGSSAPVIYVVGGVDSVSNSVTSRIKKAASVVADGNVTVTRVGGTDRYATSALVATQKGAVANSVSFGSGVGAVTAILASGQVNADALAAGPLSYAWGIPVLLTPANGLPASVRDVINSHGIKQLLVLGGTDRIPQAVLSQAKTAGVELTKRIAGGDRFDTAAKLYTFAMDTMHDRGGDRYGVTGGATAYLANGLTGFPDALAAGPLAGSSESPLLTSSPNVLSASTAAFLAAHRSTLQSTVGLGSPASIALPVLTAAQEALQAGGESGAPAGSAAGGGADAGTGGTPLPGSNRAPTVTGVFPSSGPVIGGQTVTVSGINLTGATEVMFGEEDATDVHVVSDTSITVVTPAGYPAAVDVTVTTANGTSAAQSSDQYTFSMPPDVSNATYTPAAGVVTGSANDVVSASGGDTTGEGESFSQSNYVVTLSVNASVPVVGNSYYIPAGGNVLPSGLAGTVTAVTDSADGQHVITVQPGSLDKIFKSVNVEYTGLAGVDDAAHGLRSASRGAFRQDIDTEGPKLTGTVDFGAAPDSWFQCNISGSIEGSVNIKLENVKTTFTLTTGGLLSEPYVAAYVSYEVVPEFNFSSTAATECKLGAVAQAKMKKIIPIADTGLTLSFAPDVSFQISAKGTIQVSEHLYREVGIISNPDGSIRSLNAKSSEPPEAAASGTLQAELFVGADIQFGVLDTVGVGIATGVAGDAVAIDVDGPPPAICVTLSASIPVQLYAYLNVWITEWKFQFVKLTFTFAKAGPLCIPLSDAPPATQPPTIVTTDLPFATLSAPYSAELTTSDGRVGTWAASAMPPATVALPPGLTLDGYTISGTPTQLGTFPFTLTFTDDDGLTDSVVSSIQVVQGDLKISTETLPDPKFGVAYSATLAAEAGTAPYTWAIQSGNLPAGLSLSTDGIISGTPTEAAVTTVTVEVSDSGGDMASKQFTLTMDVSPGEIAGTVTAGSAAAAVPGVTIDIYNDSDTQPTLTATAGPDGKYQVPNVPTGSYTVCFDASTATGGPSAAGYFDQCHDAVPWRAGVPVPDGTSAVSVTPSTITTVDATLVEAAGFTGTVTGLADAGLGDVQVDLFDGAGSELDAGKTASDGTYKVVRLQPGQYDVCFDATNATGSSAMAGYANQCAAAVAVVWDGGTKPATGSIRQTAAAGDLTIVDRQLTSYWAATGTVTDTSGNALSGVSVSVVTGAGEFATVDKLPATTDSEGTFTAKGLTAGSYYVCFDGRPAKGTTSTTGYISQCYNGIAWGDAFPPPTGSTTVAVTLGALTTISATESSAPIQLAPGGAVSGTVTDSGSARLAGVKVRAVSNTGLTVATATTGSDGTYEMSGVPAGSYAICFDGRSITGETAPAGYAFSCAGGVNLANYNTGAPSTTPTAVAVNDTATVDGTLAEATGISGTVTDATAAPLGGVVVEISTATPGITLGTAGIAHVGVDGTYRFVGLPAATYQVCFDATHATGGSSTTGYVNQCWNSVVWPGTDWPTNATDVDAVAGHVSQSVDAYLHAASSITGTVTDADKDEPLQGAGVDVWAADGTGHVYGAMSTADGSYTVKALPPGEYVVCFNGRTAHLADTVVAGYASQCDTDMGWTGGLLSAPSGAKHIFVADGSETTVDAALHAGGAIAGAVTETDTDNPVADVKVTAYSGSDESTQVGQVTTGVDGRYVLVGLQAGNYTVCFAADKSVGGDSGTGHQSVCYDDVDWTESTSALPSGTTPVSVTAGATANSVDATLTVGAAISGTVTANTGEKLADVSVRVNSAADGSNVGQMATSSDGTYTFQGLVPGTYYVCFNPSSATGGSAAYGYAQECFDGEVGATSTGTPVTAVAGRVTTVDSQLTPNWQVTGTVTDKDNDPLANVRVELLGPNYQEETGYTDGAGRYSVDGAIPGLYYVCFDPSSATGGSAPLGYAAACHGDVPWLGYTWSPAGATTVSPTGGELMDGIDMVLSNAGAISGTVSQSGSGIGGVYVAVFDAAGNNVTSATTDDGGTYIVAGLAPRDNGYQVCFDASNATGQPTGYIDACYADLPWTGSWQDIPIGTLPVTVTADVTTPSIDQEVATGGEIHGTVTGGADKSPLQSANVSLYADGTYLAGTDTVDDGAYAFTGLAPGTYQVCVDASRVQQGIATGGYLPTCTYAGGEQVGGTATEISGTESNDISPNLSVGGGITGTVTADGAGVARVEVDVYDGDGNFVGSATTDATGGYTIVGLATGSYQVCFDTRNLTRTAGSYLGQCYNGKAKSNGPSAANTAIAVTEGSVVPRIDANLSIGAAITGTVAGNDTDGHGISGISVTAYLAGTYQSVASAQTDDNGNYSLALPGGPNVAVCVDDYSAGIRNQVAGYISGCHGSDKIGGQASVAAITGVTTGGVDVAMTRGGIVSGTATDTAEPPAGLGSVWIYLIPTGGGQVQFADTDASNDYGEHIGSYATPAIPAGTYYVCFDATEATGGGSNTGYLSQCAGNVDWNRDTTSAPAGAAVVTVTAGQVTAQDVALSDGGAIAGTVRDASGDKLSGVGVIAYNSDSFGVGFTTTDDNGAYLMAGLASGSYNVCFDGSAARGGGITTGFVSACYGIDGAGRIPPNTGAGKVDATAGNSTEGIDQILTPGSEIDGTITDPDGQGLDSASVTAFTSDGSWYNNVTTDGDGNYQLEGLEPGTDYYVCAAQPYGTPAPGYATTCYPDAPLGSDYVPDGTPVTAPNTAGTVADTTIDITLPKATP